MNEARTNEVNPATEEKAIDPVQLQYALQRLRAEQNLVVGVVVGFIAALVGAALWALVTVVTKYQIGWMAVGVGFLVGFAIRIAGKGVDKVFGYASALLSLFGCGLGNLLAVCALISLQNNLSFLEVLSRLNLELIIQIMVETFRPLDLLFYGIALYEGYRLSFRQLSQEELAKLLPGVRSA